MCIIPSHDLNFIAVCALCTIESIVYVVVYFESISKGFKETKCHIAQGKEHFGGL